MTRMMKTFFIGAAVGSLVMFLVDPENGRRRRFVAKDKYNRLKNYTKSKASDFKIGAHKEIEHTLQ